MIYISAVYANAERTLVTGTDADGNTQTVPITYKVHRCPEQSIEGFLASGGTISDYEEPAVVEPPVALHQVAGTKLAVDQSSWEVSGVERSSGIAGAFLTDVDTVWIVFNEELPDDDYVVIPDTGVTKHAGYIEVQRPGLETINLVVQRVQ